MLLRLKVLVEGLGHLTAISDTLRNVLRQAIPRRRLLFECIEYKDHLGKLGQYVGQVGYVAQHRCTCDEVAAPYPLFLFDEIEDPRHDPNQQSIPPEVMEKLKDHLPKPERPGQLQGEPMMAGRGIGPGASVFDGAWNRAL